MLDLPIDDAGAILSGRALDEVGIQGAVESDFFDWISNSPTAATWSFASPDRPRASGCAMCKLDVLKSLYESLIDPAQRHDLGEYYTPDWLAAKVTARALADPLKQRVLDPACGSGTFLFHAIRRKLAAADAAGLTRAAAVAACVQQVRGLDVHPVAVIIARVTWLLALGPAIEERIGELHVPVYLGDAMQWNLRQVGDTRDVVVQVPDDAPLHVPAGFAEDQARFEHGVQTLTQGLHDAASPEQVERSLLRIEGVAAPGRRPRWQRVRAIARALRHGAQRHLAVRAAQSDAPVCGCRGPSSSADVLFGNPPWIAYRHLSAEMKPRLRAACRQMNLWVGGVLATQQDMSALFWARGAERYLKPGGTIAFVLPYAAINRPAFTGLRRGDFGTVQTRVVEAWDLARVRPIFGGAIGTTSTCVMFGRREPAGMLPSEVEQFSGTLSRRDASEAEADASLRRVRETWPPVTTLGAGSPHYRARFKQGATIVPRRFFFVEREPAARLGDNPAAPRVHGRIGALDRMPWREVEPPRGAIEAQFLRTVLLGEGIAPFAS